MDSGGDPHSVLHPHTSGPTNPPKEQAWRQSKNAMKRRRKKLRQQAAALKLEQGPSELQKEEPRTPQVRQISTPGALATGSHGHSETPLPTNPTKKQDRRTMMQWLGSWLPHFNKEDTPTPFSATDIKEQEELLKSERARLRHSVLYSDRPRRSKRSITDKIPVEENAGKVSGSEGPTVADLPEFKVLALNEAPPKPELTDRSKECDTANSETESEVAVEEEPKDESDCDSEEEWRKFKEYKERMFDKDFAPQSATQAVASDKNSAVDHVTEYSGVAEWAERSYLTWQKSFQVCSEAQHTMVASSSDEPTSEVSDEEIFQNGEKWMSEEVMVAFKQYIRRIDKLGEIKYCFEKLRRQCLNVECYFKIFHHFNFTAKTKLPSSDVWESRTYFAELKEMFGEKYYFCCPLESRENGQCYACRNQGVDDLMHPATGGFERGLTDTVVPYM